MSKTPALKSAPMRREFLKGYLLALLAEGGFKGSLSPVDMARKAFTTFSMDVPAVIGEIVEVAAQNTSDRLPAFIFGKMADVAKDLDRRGPKAVFEDMKAMWGATMRQYKRGVEVKAARREGK